MVTSIDNRNVQKAPLHPHKFILWVAMASIVMMFAGFTSAYIVKHAQKNWLEFSLPKIFQVSTVVIILSSLTMHLAVKAFKVRERSRYKKLITLTALLGISFAVLQVIGFTDLNAYGIRFIGSGSNASASFLLVIVGMHVLHVLGGVVALVIAFFRAYRTKIKSYNIVPVEIVATYWHFVDILWIYLFIFFTLYSS
ncbi:MAG: cytochrome c oxidase subunit 3 [Chitinophagaceae bacterium]|jgi:cytochrome c oxidase subunit 3|nr:cytochrome c oxidase subunit 3 [Chitinophagaceae bacterium]